EEVDISFAEHADYAAMARGAGIERVFKFNSLDSFKQQWGEAVLTPGHTFIVLEVERLAREGRTPAFDGPELKFRVGRPIQKAHRAQDFHGMNRRMLKIDRVTVALLVTLAVATAPTAVAALTAEEFYRGKAIKVIVPTGPGGTYALFGSLINERVSHFMPGNPALVMQFMPSGIQATNYLYNVPAKDGLTIGMLSQTAGMIQVLTPEHVKYDLRKFQALGLFSQLNAVLTVSERTPVKSVNDLKTTPITLGATDASTYQHVIPLMMNSYVETRMASITGYKGIAETTLAMERGEVDGVFTSWLAIKEQRSKALQNDRGRALLQVGYNSEPDLDAPLLHKLAPDEKAAKAFAFV